MTTINDNKMTKQTKSTGGNKSTPVDKEILEKMKKVHSRKWFITVFPESTTHTTELIQEIKKLGDFARYWGYGIENAPTTGRVHLHIYLEYKSSRTMYQLRTTLGPGDYQKAKGKLLECAKYFAKGGVYETNIDIPKPVKVIEDLYPWQKYIKGKLLEEEVNDRYIFWVYDKKGAKGKTALCKHLLVKYPKKILIINGRMQDICNGLKNHHEIHGVYPTGIIMNIPREQKNVSYKGIESLKDGLIVNTKYEVSSHVFNSPVVVVFSNTPPLLDKFSQDRWQVYCLDELKEVMDEFDEKGLLSNK